MCKDVVALDQVKGQCTSGNGLVLLLRMLPDGVLNSVGGMWPRVVTSWTSRNRRARSPCSARFRVDSYIARIQHESTEPIEECTVQCGENHTIVSDASSNFFEVTLHDLAWQKFAFNDSLGTLILSFEQRDRELPVIASDRLKIAAGGTYLITGGLGGFGQQTARWLVEHGCESLVLTGRSGANTPTRRSLSRSSKRRVPRFWLLHVIRRIGQR